MTYLRIYYVCNVVNDLHFGQPMEADTGYTYISATSRSGSDKSCTFARSSRRAVIAPSLLVPVGSPIDGHCGSQ